MERGRFENLSVSFDFFQAVKSFDVKTYWHILKQYRVGLWISPLLVMIVVLCETIQPYFMSVVVDRGVLLRDMSVITHIGGWMIGSALIGLVANVCNVYVSSRVSTGFGTDLRATLFAHIQRLSFSDIDRFGSSSLITRMTNDITKIQQVVLMSMRLLLRAPMMLCLAIFFVVRIDAEMAWVLLGCIPLLGGGVYLILRKGFPFFMRVQRLVDALNGVVRENLINIRVVKSFVREDFETRKFEARSEQLKDTVIRASNIVVLLFPLMQLILNLSVVVILWSGAYRVASGTLQVGELISFVNYLMQILMSLMMLSMVIMIVARAAASSQRVNEVLDAEPSLTDTPVGRQNRYRVERGEVEFRNVSFRYAGGETDVLHEVSFQVHSGEVVAVAGATGAAKSSLMQLIPRLYDVTRGEVRVDGVDVRDYALEALHQGIGMVLQQSELFSGSILENLRWGKADASREEVEQAARAAQAHAFIEAMPEGYDTLLGRGGVNLSGGQKQRLCIARALLRRPKVLILDDSTSAVDAETERNLWHSLRAYLGRTTLLVITQRVQTMQAADRVMVLEEGRLEAIGTPEELQVVSPAYREIYRSQQLFV